MNILIWQFLGIFLNERAFIVACIEIFTGFVLAFLTRNLFLRYKQRQAIALRYLIFTTLFLCLTAWSQLLDQFLFDPFLRTHNLGLGIAYCMSAIANIFWAWFMLEIFGSGRASGGSKITIFMIVEGAIAILSPIVAPISLDVFLPILIIHVVLAFILYFTFIKVTTNGIKKTGDPITRKGFAYLRAGGVTIMITYLSFVLDQLWDNLFTITYSEWAIFGWLCAGITGIMLFQGFVYPTKARAQAEIADEV